MATLHHAPPSTNYALDFSPVSGVLDLSRSKPKPEPHMQRPAFYREPYSPLHRNYDHKVVSHSPPSSDPAHLPRLSPLRNSSPVDFNQLNCRGAFYGENLNTSFNGHNRSPSLYSTEGKDLSRSPQDLSGQSSPTYASCYPAPEQFSPYIIQAAFRQQLLIQNKQPKQETDAVSDAGSDGSNTSTFPTYPLVGPGRDGKISRPFKAYPKDPMSLAAGFSSVDALLDTQSAEKYSAFRKRMLEQICAANGGQATVTNPKMRRTIATTGNNNCYTSDDGSVKYDHPGKDDSYTERRKKNNAAAKKSRDRRRIKEDEIAIRAAFLERENIELKLELASFRKQHALCAITTNLRTSNS